MTRTIKHADRANASAMLDEARANLDALQHFSAELVTCHEGVIFINLLAQTAHDALLFCHRNFSDLNRREGDFE